MATTQISFCAAQTIISAADASDGDAVGSFCLGAQQFPGCMVEVYCDFSGSTDNLNVRVYGSVDGTNVDTVPVTSFQIATAAEARASFSLEHLYWFRLDCTLAGTPSDKGAVTAKVMPWEYTSA